MEPSWCLASCSLPSQLLSFSPNAAALKLPFTWRHNVPYIHKLLMVLL
ncbi:hypothetical protein SynMVIR181_02965 [Synechococcus sp. MVIR-18-1]|nr:hypothetical protein SynMVIR181_02965 [Synechococcus sp. MVIR-18-1]